MKYSGTYTANLVDFVESPRQKLPTEKSTTAQTWRNWSESRPCHVSNVSRNYEPITYSPTHTHPYKTLVNTQEHQKTPCKLIWFGNNLHLVATTTYWAVDVLSISFFAYPTVSQVTKTNSRVINIIITNHTYLPQAISFDKEKAFVTQVFKELVITLEQSTTKSAQSIGTLERTHASLKKAFSVEAGERTAMCHKYVNIAVQIHHTSYNTNIGCEHSRVFYECVSHNVPDMEMGIRSQKSFIPNSQVAQKFLSQKETILQDVHENARQAYIKYKAYYEKQTLLRLGSSNISRRHNRNEISRE